MPDGLLEVRLQGESEDDLFLLEVATYPDRRVENQLTRDVMLVYLDRGQLPETVTLVLRPKGKFRVPSGRNLRSPRGLSSCRLSWRVVELWTIPAEALLRTGDVGLIPWVPLTDFADPPEAIIQRCREAIDANAPPGETANFLAVTQVLTGLRYNKDAGLLTVLLSLLGGRQAMLESPVIQDLLTAQARTTAQEDIVTFLEERFGHVPEDFAMEIRSVVEEDRLRELVRKAASCADLEAFRKALAPDN